MKVDLRTPPAHPVLEMVKFAQRCEEAGFSGVGINDCQQDFRDLYVVMSHILRDTERLRVHPAVACPGPRHTSVIASAAKTVQEFGPDRFELWLARGDAAPNGIGLPMLTVGEMRDAITEIKAFMAGETGVYKPLGKDHPGNRHHHALADVRLYHGGGTPVPVYVGAGAGPLLTRIAGELCDGILLVSPYTAEGLAERRKWLAEGAARAGRDVSEIHIVLKIFCVIRDTRKQAVRNWSPRLLGALAGKDAETRLQALGIEYDITRLKPAFVEAQTKLRRLGPSSHITDWEAAEEIAEVIPYELQEAMGDAVAILDDPDQVTKRFKELEGLGIDHVYIYNAEAMRLPEPELRAFKEVIGPALSASI